MNRRCKFFKGKKYDLPALMASEINQVYYDVPYIGFAGGS